MIDIHNHSLPNIDDGAKNLKESIAILDSLDKQGVRFVVFTPHYYGQRKSVQQFLSKRDEAFSFVNQAYRGNIQFVLGCECNISTCANNDFSDLEALTIGDTRYILTEMSFEDEWDERLWTRLGNLLDLGLTPVIAHVELYPAVHKKPQLAHRLIENGCLLQINCDSVLDEAGYGLVKALIAHDQAHCLGSDTHNLDQRPPHYEEAVKRLEKDFGKQFSDRLQENMKKILENQEVKTKDSVPIKRTLFGKLK